MLFESSYPPTVAFAAMQIANERREDREGLAYLCKALSGERGDEPL